MSNFIIGFIEAGKGSDFRKLDDLKENTLYRIIQFNLKTTPYGMALEAEIEDPESLEPFKCFFPERLARKVKSEEELNQLNDMNFSFIFRGRVNKVAILEFSTPLN